MDKKKKMKERKKSREKNPKKSETVPHNLAVGDPLTLKLLSIHSGLKHISNYARVVKKQDFWWKRDGSIKQEGLSKTLKS